MELKRGQLKPSRCGAKHACLTTGIDFLLPAWRTYWDGLDTSNEEMKTTWRDWLFL